MKRVVIIAAAIVVTLAIAVVGFIAVRAGWISIKPSVKEYTYSLGEFTVNLDDPGYKRFIKVNIQAGYNYKKLNKELTESSYKISDIINNVLRSKKLDDVNTPEKTDTVKKEIKDKINDILSGNKLTAVYFSEIIIQ
jgi:flagellar FliL protein